MLIRKHDASVDDHEWREFLIRHDFGQLIAAGRDRDVPMVVPTHFVFDGDSCIVLHLARPNPMWEALSENPRAMVAVAGAYAYIPTYVNAGPEEEREYGVPTSYYAAVQAIGTCEVVDDPEPLASILSAQLAHFQPEGRHQPVAPGDNPSGKQMNAIRGIRLSIDEVRAKFKFGGNKTVEHRREIAKWLASRDDPASAEAVQHSMRRPPGL